MYNIYACILTSNYEKAFVFFLIARFSNTFERRQYAGRYRNFILKYIIEALHFIFFDVSIKSSVMTLVVNTKFVFFVKHNKNFCIIFIFNLSEWNEANESTLYFLVTIPFTDEAPLWIPLTVADTLLRNIQCKCSLWVNIRVLQLNFFLQLLKLIVRKWGYSLYKNFSLYFSFLFFQKFGVN